MTLEEITGKIIISSSPEDAQIFIDGIFGGNTPMEKELPIGTYIIELKKENYKTKSEQVIIKDNSTVSLQLLLEDIQPIKNIEICPV